MQPKEGDRRSIIPLGPPLKPNNAGENYYAQPDDKGGQKPVEPVVTQGPKGDKGDKGDQGPVGPRGPIGNDGHDGRGLQGAQGPKGDQGKDGKDGKPGLSAYEEAVANKTFLGTYDQWVQNMKGQRGFDGLSGQDGAQGLQGPEGKLSNKWKTTIIGGAVLGGIGFATGIAALLIVLNHDQGPTTIQPTPAPTQSGTFIPDGANGIINADKIILP